MEQKWHDFACDHFIFEDHEAVVVLPREEDNIHRLAVKTEYWHAFHEAAEIELANRGFTLCYIKNDNRWGTDEDLDRKARFIRHVQNEYGLVNTCVPIGMSCGGLFAIKLAARYPELVSCLYLDAPVVNYMSCPCGFGIGKSSLNGNFAEILNALGMDSISQLLAYRDMPLDHIPDLAAHKIPIVLVAGDSDELVPFTENGFYLEQAYKKAGVPIEVYMKPGCGHHPHGLEKNQPVVDFIMKYSG